MRDGAGKRSDRKLPMPSPVTGTNLVIADVVLRAAGGILRRRLQKSIAAESHRAGEPGRDKAEKMIENRGVMSTIALWGASRVARKSPLGLAMVVGGFAAKVFYDRGKHLEPKRSPRRRTRR